MNLNRISHQCNKVAAVVLEVLPNQSVLRLAHFRLQILSHHLDLCGHLQLHLCLGLLIHPTHLDDLFFPVEHKDKPTLFCYQSEIIEAALACNP